MNLTPWPQNCAQTGCPDGDGRISLAPVTDDHSCMRVHLYSYPQIWYRNNVYICLKGSFYLRCLLPFLSDHHSVTSKKQCTEICWTWALRGEFCLNSASSFGAYILWSPIGTSSSGSTSVSSSVLWRSCHGIRVIVCGLSSGTQTCTVDLFMSVDFEPVFPIHNNMRAP